jgi:hypothetical protein
MKQGFDSNDKNQETAEKRLAALIKQAGDEARARKRKAMAWHFKKLQTVIGEAVSRRQDSIPT